MLEGQRLDNVRLKRREKEKPREKRGVSHGPKRLLPAVCTRCSFFIQPIEKKKIVLKNIRGRNMAGWASPM